MNKDCRAQARPEGSAPSEKHTQKTQRYIASKEIPGSTHVYLTHKSGDYFTLFTDSLWMGDWNFADSWVNMTTLYRHARQKLNRAPITFHLPTVDLALDLLDQLENEVRFKRLALVWDEAMPPAPANPDQHLVDCIAEIEAVCDVLATDP